MVQSVKRLKVFFSCTSELDAERKVFPQVIADVNRVVEDSLLITLRLIDLRNDIYPGVASYPQDVINLQTSDYQIYVGLLGTRFGSPTPRAGSGTEEEFNIAYAKFLQDPTSVRLLFYFKEGFVGNIHEIDSEQLRRVQQFRTKLGREKGVFFQEYRSPEEFISLSRNHLHQLLQNDWNGSAWKPVPGFTRPIESEFKSFLEDVKESPQPGLSEDEESFDENEEPTILDLRVEMDDSFQAAMGAVGKISELMQLSGEKFKHWPTQVNALVKSGSFSPKKAQDLVNVIAKGLAEFSKQLRPLVALFRSSSDEFFERMEDIIARQIMSGISTPQLMIDGINMLAKVDATVLAARDLYSGMAGTVSSLPAPTREFKRQQRNATSQINELAATIANWLDRSKALQEKFRLRTDQGEAEDTNNRPANNSSMKGVVKGKTPPANSEKRSFPDN